MRDDIIEIPIEFRTEDKRELREIKKEVDELEKKSTKFKSQGAPIHTETPTGIFRPTGEEETLPLSKGKDKTSRQAVQPSDNEFKKVKNQIKTLEDALKETRSKFDELTGLAQNPVMGIVNKLARIPGFSEIIIGIIFSKVVLDMLTEFMFGVSGPFDRRFKRQLEKELANTLDRGRKAEISQGFRVIRMTSFSGDRNPGGRIGNTLEAIYNGKPLLDNEFESLSKGMVYR